MISPAARRGAGGRGRGARAAEPIVWGAARRGAGCLEAGCDWWSRAGRVGAARRVLSAREPERPCARAVRLHAEAAGPHARPARAPWAGSARLAATWRVSGWSLWLIFAVLLSFPGLRGASFLGPRWGRQERPRVSKLSLLEKKNNNNNHRCLSTWVGVALWKWRRGEGVEGWEEAAPGLWVLEERHSPPPARFSLALPFLKCSWVGCSWELKEVLLVFCSRALARSLFFFFFFFVCYWFSAVLAFRQPLW